MSPEATAGQFFKQENTAETAGVNMIIKPHNATSPAGTEVRPAQESIDGLFRNKVQVIQAERGYRVSEDALILTWFAQPQPGEFILDAGTGCGVIAFGLVLREPSVRVVGLEIQGGLADRAARGAQLNRMEAQVSIVRGDVKEGDLYFRHGSFDTVISNPPYYETGSGRINRHQEKALARHQLMMPLDKLFETSRSILKPEGRIVLIYPANRFDRVELAMKDAGFTPSRMLWIHPHEGAEPYLTCLEAGSNHRGEPLIEEPLMLYDGLKARTSKAEAILAGE